MKKITIKDIASMADVSPTTVSLVLNNRPSRISEAKREEIFEIAERHNYTPNLNAKGLVQNKTNIIGLIIPDIENPFFARLAKTIEIELNKHKYSLILINNSDIYQNDINALKLLNGRGVDAFLLVLSNEAYNKEEEVKRMLESLNKPFVLIDRVYDNINCNKVSFDNKYGEYLATRFLIEQGFRRIGYIASPKNSFNGEKRFDGYLKALDENNIMLDESIIRFGDYRFDSGYLLAKEIIDNNIEAMVVANDMMAYGAMQRLDEMNLKVPQDISLIGYDDLTYSSMNVFSLTTIRQDLKVLGEDSVRLLIKNMENKNNINNIVYKPDLVIRKSVKMR